MAGPRETVRLRLTSSATLDWERPRSRAIARADLFLSSPRSMAALSALSSLLYLLCPLPDIGISFRSLGAPSAPLVGRNYRTQPYMSR